MQRNEIEEGLLKLLGENGFELQNEDQKEDVLLDMDSLQFISLIADIEEFFGIVIPDEFLIQSEQVYLFNFVEMVEKAIEESGDEKQAALPEMSDENNNVSDS
ncbi:MAG: phosphopantetheine-binding protein [Lachnospiraceae bacterium]